ncbi:MAG: hypothetical protein HY272_08835 [Gammaproteobacteria bacterium]|nr:hypothetical protein [Gammaproteobacteria bacterium]
MRIDFLKSLRLVLNTLFVLIAIQLNTVTAMAGGVEGLAMLLPDDVVSSDPRMQTWRDAADEEGLQLEFITDSQFLQMGLTSLKYKGIILPDQIHQRASNELIASVKEYVSRGGRLMLVYDAGVLTDAGFYPPVKSRFSDLVGVDYVLYDALREFTIGLGPVLGIEKTLWELQVPPGKSMPFSGVPLLSPQYLQSDSTNPGGVINYDHRLHQKLKYQKRNDAQADQRFLGVIKGPKINHGHHSPGAIYDSKEDGGSNDYDLDETDYIFKKNRDKSPHTVNLPQPISPSTSVYGVSGYVYGFLDYPSYVTQGNYTGTVLLSSMDFGLVAGLNNFGNGKVLFVNTPLSYLKGQTDGMLMHGFLRYFGADLLGLPRLANHPKGRGGMVLNWHLDSAEALQPIQTLDTQGIWDQGPYSIHLTAGPDAIVPGDGLGLNVPNNPVTQRWIKYFVRKGHQVGSHGGWVHDYYGINANELNQAQFEPFLVLNKSAIENVTKQPITEYSAPQGNNPVWAMNWLERNGIVGYYFTGHTGMGPTRGYRQGMLMNPGMWAFPVSTLGEYATFEEFSQYGVSQAEINRWLDALVDFSVHNRTSRLIYFHPPGAADYPDVMKSLLDRTDAYEANKKFEWYTMTDLSNFLTSRRQVSWHVVEDAYGRIKFVATHPESLAKQTWLLPKNSYGKPYIQKGKAKVEEGDKNWVVIARSGRELQFAAMPLN